MAETSRFAAAPTPDCVGCHEPSEHLSEIGVWVCPYCGDMAIEYRETAANGPVLKTSPTGDEPVDTIKILGEVAMEGGLKAVLDTPFASKDDFLELSIPATGRRWDPGRSAWIVDAAATEHVKEHLREADWPVIDLVQLRRERRGGGPT
jgi:predicted RNA-binding Zn-ribbon protein involved in translation (DUF1610 family)